MANILFQTGQYQKAIEKYLKSLEYLEDLKDSNYYVTTYYNISTVYIMLQQPEKALEYLHKAIRHINPDSPLRYRVTLNVTQGQILYQLGRFREAIPHFKKTQILAEKYYVVQVLPAVYQNLAETYLKVKQLDSASNYFDLAMRAAKTMNASEQQKIAILSTGAMIAKEKKQYDLSLQYLDKALEQSKNSGHLDMEKEILRLKVDVLREAGQPFKALSVMDEYLKLKDSVDQINNRKAIAELEQKYQAEKKERENLQLKKEKAEQALALQRQTQRTRTLMAASGGTLLLSGMFMFFWVRMRRKNKTIRQLQRVLAHRTKGYLQKIVDFIDYIVEYIKETEATPEEIAVKVEELKSRIMTIIRAQELIMRKGGILSLDEYMEALAGEWRAMLKDRHIAIRTEVEEGLQLSGAQVLPVGLVLDEFVLNSSKYAFDEGHRSPEIRINARAEGGKLILEMRDNGRGGSVEEVKGSGFGLNMVRRIVEHQLKGKLLIDGSDGFYMRVEMPLEQPASKVTKGEIRVEKQI